jgi:cytochrome P450
MMYVCSEPNKPPGLHKDFWRLTQQFGPIYTLYFGSKRSVVLNSRELFYEALHEKQHITSQRPSLKSFNEITYRQGVAMNNGERWRAIRKILQTKVTSKPLGEKSEPLIMEEINCTLAWLRDQCDAGGKGCGDFDFRQLCRRESLNVAMRKLFGFRFGVKMSPEYLDTQDWIRIIFEHLAQGSPSDFMPIFDLFPDPGKKEFSLVCKRMHKFLNSELQKHKTNLNLRGGIGNISTNGTTIIGEDGDFLDLMLLIQHESRKEKQDVFIMEDLDITVCAWDMMAGAIDTSATSMEWLIYILCNNKHVQDKMHQELDAVVGPDRFPTYADYPNLPYCLSVLDELFRWKHFAPQGLPHQAAEDMTLGGYTIPKGTDIFLNFYSLHMNEKYWNNPQEFRPERFMEEEKELLNVILHTETFAKDLNSYKFVPFGQGRRRCVGYGLGRVVMFLKAVTWLHCFDWKSIDGKPMDLDTEILGITMMPKEQKVMAIPRSVARLLKGEEMLKGVETR